MTHQHNTDPARGPVCSQFVTDEHFQAWGIDVERTDKVVGSKVVIRPGAKHNVAMHAAWEAGHVRICTARPEDTRAANVAAMAWTRPSAEFVATAMAFPKAS